MRKFLLFLVFFLCTTLSFAQVEERADSLLSLIPQQHDSVKVRLLNEVAVLYEKISPQLMIQYSAQAAEVAEKSLADSEGFALAHFNMGNGYFVTGNYPKALEPLMKAYHIHQKQNDRLKMAEILQLIGGVHLRQRHYPLALESYVQALSIFEEMMISSQISNAKINIGETYLKQGELRIAMQYEQEAMAIAKRKNMVVEMARAKGIMGLIYEKQGLTQRALLFLLSALNELKLHDNLDVKAEYSICVARLERIKGNTDKAESFAKQGLKWAKEMQSKHWVQSAYEELARIYEAQGDYQAAVDAYKVYNLFKDSIFNSVNSALLLDLQTNFESQQQRNEINEKKIEIAQLEQQGNYIIIIAVIFVIAFFTLFLSFRNARQKKRLLEVSHKAIEDKNEEILAQRLAIEQKNQEIERKNQNIMSSLQYAKRIQRTLMPSEQTLLSHVHDGFILLKPRDVVSGDFYWFDVVNDLTSRPKKIIAAVDSTGHGVPGALMSMIGLEQLTEIVNVENIHCADMILNRLHQGVINILKQQNSNNKDGMDMALCIIDEKEKTLEFAGAKNGIFYIKDGEAHYLKGDRKSIGGEVRKREERRLFSKQTIRWEKELTFYLFSDGFQDQFGGPDQRKFTRKRFRELLMSIHQKPMAEQQKILETKLSDWMYESNEKQIDDVLVMGFHLT